MTPARFQAVTSQYPGLRIAVVGDFCLDRYLEIDPARSEVSIETGLPVHNVVRVRAQPGGAGTVAGRPNPARSNPIPGKHRSRPDRVGRMAGPRTREGREAVRR